MPLATPTMAAFVTTPARLASPSSAPRTLCRRRAAVRAARRSRMLPTMCAEQPEGDAPAPPPAGGEEAQAPAEPYPGFFADMKRMGLTEEEALAQAQKAANQKKPVKSDKVGGKKNLLKPDGTPYAPWMANIAGTFWARRHACGETACREASCRGHIVRV